MKQPKQSQEQRRADLHKQLKQPYLEPWQRERILQHLFHLDQYKPSNSANTQSQLPKG